MNEVCANSLCFPAILDYNTKSFNVPVKMKQQFISFYNHCNKFGKETEGAPTSRLSHVQSKTIIFDLSDKLPENLIKVQVTFNKVVMGHNYSLNQVWTFTKASGRIKRFEILDKEKFIAERFMPFAYFKGNELECIKQPLDKSVAPSTYWDNWKNSEEVIQTYRSRIYPLLNLVVNEFANLRNTPIVVQDVGGGDGELAFQLAELPFVQEMYLLDNNDKQLKLAENRKGCDCPFLSEEARSKTRVIKTDLTSPDCFEQVSDNMADVIILSGVVAHSVLTRESSASLLELSYNQLKDEGIVCIASLTPPYFAKEEYESMGFKVLNQVASMSKSDEPWSQASRTGNWTVELEPFYILQKSSAHLQHAKD